MIETTGKITRYDDGKENMVFVRSSSRQNMVELVVGDVKIMVLGKDLQLAVENCLRSAPPPPLTLYDIAHPQISPLAAGARSRNS